MSTKAGEPPAPVEETYSVDDVEPPRTEPYDPEPQRETLRGRLAIGVIAILGAAVLLSFIAMWQDWASPAEIKDLMSGLFPPLVALAGTALGFYFGGRGR